MKHSIKAAVWRRVVIVFCTVIISGLVTQLGLKRLDAYNQSTAEATSLLSMALNAEKAHYSWIENLSSAVGLGTEFTGSTDCTTCTLGQWLYQTDRNTLPSQDIVQLMDEIEPLHKAIHESATEIISLKQTDPEKAKTLYQESTKANVNKLVVLLDKVVEVSNGLVSANEKGLEKSIVFIVAVSICTVILTLVVNLILVYYINKRALSPIAQITVCAERLSQGLLDTHVDVESNDEVGILAKSLNDSCRTLSLYINDISDKLHELAKGNLTIQNDLQYVGDFVKIQDSITLIINGLNTTMAQISQAAVEVSHGADQISNSSVSLAQGATEQSQEIDQLMSRIDEVSKKIAANAQDAAFTSKTAEELGSQIGVCNGQMHKMAEAMQQISYSSQQIQDIIKTIEDIAFQTNILALNAAVEAARAGAAGKGFAVVADEVRNLASKSGDAAKSTTALIEESMRSVEAGVSLMNVTQKSLDSVVSGARSVTEKIKNISDSSAEQASVVSSIDEGISQIAQVVQTNSATSEEGAAASEQLSGQAQTLQSLVDRFHIKHPAGAL